MRRLLLAFLVLCAITPIARAQVGSATDIIRGTVRALDGRPLAGARVEVTSIETGVTRTRTTNEKGQYTLLFPDGGGQYRVVAKAIGHAPQTSSITRLADEDRLTADFRLTSAAQALAAVTVRAQQTPARQQRAEPGSTERALTGDQLRRLPVDPSDPNAVAALAPGVVSVGGSDTSAAGFSVAGQRSDANQVTLDGLSFGGSVPQEAVRNTRVITNTYDIARGQFTGGQVATTSRSGTNDIAGSFSAALRDPSLQTTNVEDAGAGFTGAYHQYQLSGGVGGPIVKDQSFWFGAVQLRRRLDPLQAITSAGPATLSALGIAPDSAARFVDLVRRFGLPIRSGAIPDNRTADNGTAILRLDHQLGENHSLSLRGNWQGSLTGGARLTPQSVPAHGGEQDGEGGALAASVSSTIGQYLHEFRGTFQRDQRRNDPYSGIPEGRVQVASQLASGQAAVTALSFGGNPQLPVDDDNGTMEFTDELSWLSDGGAHRWKLGGLLNRTSFRNTGGANRNGTFHFNSLSELENGRPVAFTRTLSQRIRSGSGVNGGVYFGDTWRQSAAFQLTYGVRAEGSQFEGRPANNPAVESRFGRRTDVFPSDVRVSPRVGFTVMLGTNPQAARRGARDSVRTARDSVRVARGDTTARARGDSTPRGGGQRAGAGALAGIRQAARGAGGAGGLGGGLGGGVGGGPGGNTNGPQPWIVRGGIGEFRGRTALGLFSSALDATGLPSGELQLACAGAVTPLPDWSGYLANVARVPTSCLDGGPAAAPLAQSRPNVTLFDPDFGAPRSWRGSLGLSRRFLQRYQAGADLSVAATRMLSGVRDLNLVPAPRFTLASEGGRPVYVPAAAIFPGSGATTVAASRLDPAFGYVFEVGSRFVSRNTQLQFTLGGASFQKLLWNVAYTWQRSTDQASNGGGNALGAYNSVLTGGDPNVVSRATSDLERRHQLFGNATFLARPWIDITAVLRLTSGAPYTPRVGGDINGDGARNDRAFIFDPASTGDTLLASAMQRVLDRAPPTAAACLRAQLGRVAERNACRTAWAAQLDIQINLRPNLGDALGRRLTIQAALLNPLAGIDRLLHGADAMRGWGQAALADPTLLYVRGFDPVAQRYRYAVNENFGANAARRAAINPFQIALQAQWQVEPDRQRQQLEQFVRGTAGGVAGLDLLSVVQRVAPSVIEPMLALADSLQLTAEQQAKLRAIDDSMHARNELLLHRIEEAAEKEYKAGGDLQSFFRQFFPKMQPTLQEARGNYLRAVDEARRTMTEAQWQRLPLSIRQPALNRAPGAGNARGGRPIP
ncbi:MAG: carboxypeptidase regulatory-like domain-containing protein [Gemmatimonadaceae bacterium]|nr:carboxypeptidase regulatory-like domain-containing protein [Gemmatimonadaceae bacterium]